jgi:tetratricopeptide (TPR) repeat protein
MLDRLQSGDFINAPDLLSEESYTFRHALTHEVAYSGMLVQARQRLHARIVNAIELLYDHRLSERLEHLAFHALQGGQWEKAITYSRQSAGKAIARDANHEAVRFLEQAIDACGRLEEGSTRIRLGIDLRFDLRGPLFRLGELTRVFDHLRAAEPLANELGDPSRSGQLNIFLNHVYWLFGNQEFALKAAEQAGRIARATSDRALAVRADLQAALCHLMLNDYRPAVGTMRETLSYLRSASADGRYGLDQPLAVVVHSYLIRGLADLGEFAQARAASKEALRLAELVDKPFSWIFAFIGFGYLDERESRPEDAVHWLSRAVDLCEVADARLMIPPAAGFLGAAYTRAGRYAEAVAILELATNEAASMGFKAQQPLRLATLAEAYAGIERWDDALASCARALAMADAQKEIGTKANALRIQAQICLSQDRSMETAERELQQATTIAEALGMRPLLQQCLRILASVHARLRDNEAAAQDLARADALLRDMGMVSSAISSVEELHRPSRRTVGSSDDRGE